MAEKSISSRPGTAASASRPGTSGRPGSRQAWVEPGQLYGKDLEKAKNDANSDTLSALKLNNADNDGELRVVPKFPETIEEKPSMGFFARMKASFAGGGGSSEDESQEMKIKTTLRELIIYVVFLVDLCVLTFGMTSPAMYYYNKVMSELFLETTVPSFMKSFRGMTQIEDFWGFAEGPLVQGLYWEKWYDGRNVSEENQGFIFYENKLLGLPRLRQLRVRDDSCVVPDAFEREIKECFDAYDETAQDKKPFGLGSRNGSAWHYHSEKELEGSSYWGKISTYGGGGYVQTLGSDEDTSMEIFAKLKAGRWLDRATRAVLIDFTVYNANINLFCVVKLVLEFPATGGVVPSWTIRTIKLLRYVTVMDYFILGCEGIFVAFLLYYFIEEVTDIYKDKCHYFKNGWNILDDVMILIGVCSIAFSVYRQQMVDEKLTGLLENSFQYANFEFLSFAQSRFNDAIAILVFFAWIKIFKYISFNKTMNQLSSTLSRCAKDVGGFAVMFFIFFFAYAQLGYLIFGTQVKDFSTFYDAVFTLLRTILGDFNFHELEQANRILGPIFFITYVFFVFFVLLNMFLAIINDTYAEVKAELATHKDEFELADYFRRGYQNMLRKLNLRKDKILDIQQALADADTNDDKVIDFDEWRVQLKLRGYAEAEIEEMFQRYDTDGDRVLDKEESDKLRDLLQGEKAVLESEMDGRSERPRTGHTNGDGFADFDNISVIGVNRRRGTGAINQEEYNILTHRVDQMELSIGGVVTKIDSLLIKVEKMEKVKMKHRAHLVNILENTHKSDASEEEKVQQLEKSLRDEIERFDKDEADDVVVTDA